MSSATQTTVFTANVPNTKNFHVTFVDNVTGKQYTGEKFSITTDKKVFSIDAHVNTMDRMTKQSYFTASTGLCPNGQDIPVLPEVSLQLAQWGEGPLTTFILMHQPTPDAKEEHSATEESTSNATE
jgi:hypothetical protein